MMKVFYKAILIGLFSLITLGFIQAVPKVTAELAGEVYNLDDEVVVKIMVEDNPGFHGLYFDLAYDGNILLFEGINKGLLAQRVTAASDFLYAVSDPVISATSGKHLIVSFGLKENGVITKENGVLAEVRFRVVASGNPQAIYHFTFNDNAAKDATGVPISAFSWEDSPAFVIGEYNNAAFINIQQPQQNQVFYTNNVLVNLICTANPDYTITILNEENNYRSAPLPAASGAVVNHSVNLVSGINRLKAVLKDQNGRKQANDEVLVYRSHDQDFIRITAPADHALINTDLVEVFVSSSASAVTVNNMPAELLLDKDGAQNRFRARLWLQQGFNEITARATGPNGEIYHDTIALFYKKDATIFRFVTPLAGETFKTPVANSGLNNTELKIYGEIGSQFKQENILNSVTLRLIYYPKSSYLSPRILVEDVPAVIKSTTINQADSRAPYMFTNDFPIDLANLENGEIEIIAYKNKVNGTSENEIHRFIYVDNGKLAIDLVQPNIFNKDVLDTKKKIAEFNNLHDPTWGDIELSHNGTLALGATDKELIKVAEFNNKKVVDVIEVSDGSLYALVNENGLMKIYKKNFGAESWGQPILSRDDMHGYSLCETSMGILVGVSNLFSADNSGLYILKEDSMLVNIILGEPITHVQFIVNNHGLISLYGNNYSHLYSFNIYSLEEADGRLKSSVVEKVEFYNDDFIRQFVLSNDRKTAVIRDNNNRICFYQNLNSTGFRPVAFNAEKLDPSGRFSTVVKGEYAEGAYNTYCLVKEDNTMLVVMENKANNRLIVNNLENGLVSGEELLGINFSNDNFNFIHKTAIASGVEYRVRKGQILFDTLYLNTSEPGVTECQVYRSNGNNLTKQNLRMVNTRLGLLYLGLGEDLQTAGFYEFTKSYPQSGSLAFTYHNRDLEGISGFSFEIDRIWLDSSDITLGFAVKEQNGAVLFGTQNFGTTNPSLKAFLAATSSYYTVSHVWDEALKKEVVTINFNELVRFDEAFNERYLDFALTLKPAGNMSPALANLTIYKKVPVRIPKAQGEIVYLPIQGWIHDPTVSEVLLQEKRLPLENGYFSCNYPINACDKEAEIAISCRNTALEEAALRFKVEIFDSVNDLQDVVFKENGNVLTFDTSNPNQLTAVSETITVSGKYFGLSGAVTGYELYGYVYDEAQHESLKNLSNGIFSTIPDETLNPLYTDYGTGYESGIFTDQSIKLYPGRQRLILYIQNPGGLRKEFKIEKTEAGKSTFLYPDVNYNLPADKQEIRIMNLELAAIPAAEQYSVNNIPVNKRINLTVNETITAPYVFTKKYLLSGEVRSLYNVNALRVKSPSAHITFENGQSEALIKVNELNRFQVEATLTLPEATKKEVYNILFIPEAPFLEHMKTGLELVAEKSFQNTNIIPSFEPIAPARWTQSELVALQKPLRVSIDRYIPEGTIINLIVNYETPISGTLVKVNPGEKIYKVMNGLDELKLKGVKPGANRIRWELTSDGKTISSSLSGKAGMNDYLFTLLSDVQYQATAVSFPIAMQEYYDNDHDDADGVKDLPKLTITKNAYTYVQVTLNGKSFWVNAEGVENWTGDLTTGPIKEGRNFLTVNYKEKSGVEKILDYTFMYDTVEPEVSIVSYRYDTANQYLTYLAALVKEANLKKATLIQFLGADSEIDSPVLVSALDNDMYKVEWLQLGTHIPVIHPSAAQPVKVMVSDQAERLKVSAIFTGLTITQTPATEDPVLINLASRSYVDNPVFMHEPGNGSFAKRLKFYNDHISMRSKEIVENFVVQRPDSISIGDNFNVTTDGSLSLKAGNSLAIWPGFSVLTGQLFNATIASVPAASNFAFAHNQASHNLSIAFWFRYEPEDYYFADPEYRKILTVYDKQIVDEVQEVDVRHTIYLAYKDLVHPAKGDECVYLLERVKGLVNNESFESVKVLLGANNELKLTKTGRSEWNLILLSITGPEWTADNPIGFFRLAVNDQYPLYATYTVNEPITDWYDASSVTPQILTGSQQYYFGDTDTDQTGHFSIAQAFYINRSIAMEDIPDLSGKLDPLTAEGGYQQFDPEPRRYYAFNNATDDVGPDFFKLHMGQCQPADYFRSEENAVYTETADKGALSASSLHKNYLKNDAEGNIVFLDATNPILYKMTQTINDNEGWIQLIPTDGSVYPGKYYFANNIGTHGVLNDRWYSVYGRVLAADNENIDARIVLSINGKEQSMQLPRGEFHFIYANTTGSTPSNVVLYLEAKTALKLDQKLYFTEGNYKLPAEAYDGLQPTRALTEYHFQKTGNIDFWYKPLNANPEGFVNYETTLVDSEYYKIFTRLTGYGYAVYSALLKGTTENLLLESKTPVIGGWQHIQLSYSVDSKLAYFYVNGEVAALSENVDLPISLTMRDHFPQGDNLCIGAALNQSQYGEGFFDEVNISHLYRKAVYQDRSPLRFAYTEQPAPALTITPTLTGLTISQIYLVLEAKDGSFRKILQPADLDHLGIDFATLAPGAYLLKSRMLINGHRYDKTFDFIRNDRPRFILKDATPLIVKGVETDISFFFDYDNSYLLTDTSAKYAGLAIQVSGTTEAGAFTEGFFITQDYQNFDHKKWLITDAEQKTVSPFPVTSNNLHIVFEKIKSSTSLTWKMRAFYFEGIFDPAEHGLATNNAELSGTIGEASIGVEKVFNFIAGINKSYEYKLKIQVGNTGSMDQNLLNDLTIGYLLTNQETKQTSSSPVPLRIARTGYLELYYDDIMPANGYGVYDCIISLRYKNETYGSAVRVLNWEKIVEEIALGNEKRLDITDFSVLHINKKTADNEQATARLYLEYEQSGLTNLYYDLKIIQPNTAGGFSEYYRTDRGTLLNSQGFMVFDTIPVPEEVSYAKLFVYELVTEDGVEKYGLKQELTLIIVNSAAAPEIQLTNTVPSLIAYNNVMFSWCGYLDNEFNSSIQYTYSLDNKGKSVLSSEWRQVEYYNLTEGAHVFKVQACYNGKYSPEATVTFFVDINRPVFDASKIKVQEITDNNGMLYAVKLNGEVGAVKDSSLKTLLINGEKVAFLTDGSFASATLPLLYDGENLFKIAAYDKVGNFTEYEVKVNNDLTKIIFPETARTARYSPLSVVGLLNSKVNSGVDIYLADPSTRHTGLNDFSGWKKAQINQDRTFLIEDVYITPGARDKETHTMLIMAVVLASGKTFTRTIDVRANEIVMPLAMDLSVHAVEGENADQQVAINCRANVDNISSWSIDFNGDGIYDEVKMVDNPALGKVYTTEHMYSALGLIKPRARVITRDGNFFSVSQELIIHEKIKEASNTLITAPLALSSLRMPDNSYRVYILAGANNNYRVEVYEIGRNENYISTKLFTIALNGLGIENPEKIKVLDENSFYLASNRGGMGYVHLLRTNEFGNYEHIYDKDFMVDDLIHDLDADQNNLYISLKNTNTLVTVPLVNGLPAADKKTSVSPEIPNALPLGGKLAIAKEAEGLLLADYYGQRIVRLSDALKIVEFKGKFGLGEGEFIYPALIESYENRIFVYDENRKDIQIFSPDFKLITTLEFKNEAGYANYLDNNFLNNLAGISVITKPEGDRLFYYALLLSKSSNKLAVLRLPQWDELRARVRNNKLVFLNNKEVFTAKISGSDLTRLISSDTLPRIEGTLNYPALSPDGRRLVFTSRTRLYDGNGTTTGSTNSNNYAYDNLYVIDENSQNLTRIPLDTINNYEIERPVFNSNGDKIIFSAKPTSGKWQIYVYNFATGAITKLFTSDENARFPYYSPDDRFVVFTTDYDGDEDLEILDTKNPSIRVTVTNNNARDSYPVWHSIYPFEITNTDYKIDSKIAFVSERGYHKGLYYTYIKRPVEADVQVVTKDGQPVGNNPDSAAIEVTSAGNEGDYPCYVGDGSALVYEYFDGTNQQLRRCDFGGANPVFSTLNIPVGATKPAGMKNTIANFTAVPINGDEVKLSWSRYTDKDIPYIVSYKINKENEKTTEKKVFAQDGTVIYGLEMGQEYLFKVSIRENNEDVATSQLKKVLMPKIVARASYELDKENPYLVRLHAWKPEKADDWKFAWLIDNQELKVQSSQDYMYEFSTSGAKTVLLKAYITDTETSISEPLYIDVVSDIKPVIEYVLADDTSYIELNAGNSLGKRIDWAATTWSISGPGQPPLPSYPGSKIIVPLDKFEHKINVNLIVRRIPITGQAATDTIEMNKVVDLDYKEVKPVITYEVAKANARMLTFNGSDSVGNIDWYGARWFVYADGNVIHNETSVSSFAFTFPESGTEVNYSVSLTIPRRNDGLTETASIIVSVEPKALEPVIDYEILKITGKNGVEGAKLLLSCGNSKGNNIDFTMATWNVPVAGTYGDQPTQHGPTAMYNLFNIQEDTQLDVELTLVRRGGTDTASVKKTIRMRTGDIPKPEIVINKTLNSASTGKVLVLDSLSSKGPNLNWEQIEWQINGEPYPKKGPVAQVDIPPSAEKTILRYTCTVYRFGDKPLTKTEEFEVGRWTIRPHITTNRVPGKNKNIYELSVRETQGVNIDWERTRWFIYDGNENVNEKTGATITHAFALKSDVLGYPAMVQMFFKGNTYPFVGYTSVDVEGDELLPIITWDAPDERTEPNVVSLSAQTSRGSNVDWSQTKWTFGDSSEGAYGSAVTHAYPLNSKNKQYKVSLTLTRRNTNGASETKTVYKTITIGSDKVKPVVTARLQGDGYLVLSAEESEGRSLMLDRSVWTFEGKGDNATVSEHIEGGVIKRNSAKLEGSIYANINANAYFETQTGTPTSIAAAGSFVRVGSKIEANAGASVNASNNQLIDTVDYSDYTNKDETFSSSNDHIGAICRRYVAGTKSLYLTLFVYRTNPDGGIDGESITVNIDLAKAGQPGGVRYE